MICVAEHSPAHLLTMARPSAFLTSSRSVVTKSREDRRSSPLASCRHPELGVSQHAAQVCHSRDPLTHVGRFAGNSREVGPSA